MSLTQIAVIIAGAWLILTGASSEITNTVTLIMGLAVVILVVLDSAFVRSYRTSRI